MSVQRELDLRAEKLDKKLQRILYMFLLHQLSLLFAKLETDRIINESYEDFMNWYRKQYKTPQNYNHEARRILKVLDTIRRDFYGVLEKRGEEKQQTERALKLRVYLISIALIYNLFHASTVELALNLKVMIKWVAVLDERTCSTCEALHGTIYDPTKETPPQRPHPSCRCRLELYVV